MSNFKVGDKVRCISTGSYEFITLGKEYVVVEARGSGYIWIGCDDGDIVPYETGLFELVEASQKPRDFLEESGKPADLPKYVIVEAKNKEFLQEVNELIAKGYKPQGGVVVDQQFYIQAMVLEN